jgi:hypothetical protein
MKMAKHDHAGMHGGKNFPAKIRPRSDALLTNKAIKGRNVNNISKFFRTITGT